MSIRSNYLYNLIWVSSGILFPLITFPYSARVLGVEGIGLVRFFSSIITYVTLFSSLGIPIYAIREIARVRDDYGKMINTTVEILSLHLFLTVLGYIVIAFICFTTPKVSNDIPLFLILSAGLLFGALGCEWFFTGNEDFKYITIRAFVVRFLSIILLFTFVHTKEDILEYAVVTVIGTVGNNLFNFYRLGRLIKFSDINWKKLQPIKRLYPALKVFVLYAIISLYTNLNAIILGFIQNNEAVGYYAAATKLTSVIIAIVGALQTVMIPRFSYLAKQETMIEFNKLCQKVIDFVLMICIPMALLTTILAPSFIRLFCGEIYKPAIMTLIIIAPMIVFVALSGIPCFQILYPLGHEREAIWSVATGGFVNLLLCAFFIPTLSYNGAAIALVTCEFVVLVTMFVYGKQYIPVKRWSKHYSNCLLAGSVMLILLLAVAAAGLNDWLNILLSSFVGFSSFIGVLMLKRDEFFLKMRKDVRILFLNNMSILLNNESIQK